ncbi:MAG: hypothetical protein GY832_46230 [Chloroflexi bacterium]|nr:hypothetical protein [Chloroflexota bacterium]
MTDIQWNELGRTWLGEKGGRLMLDHETFLERLNADTIYLVVGLGRKWQERYWPLVIGGHVVPDYEWRPLRSHRMGEWTNDERQRVD